MIMGDKYIPGKITFIHHERHRAVIEYMDGNKKKTIQADIHNSTQQKLVELKLIKKPHRFLIGDNVKFILKKTGGNGRITYAENVVYQYNTALELLINKAGIENKFLGYIKITDDEYFIKEIESYLFFPLKISPFEIAPTEKEFEKPVTFKLENLSKPDKLSASLFNHHYLPEFLEAIQHFKKGTIVAAIVDRITPFAIYLKLVNDKIEGKLSLNDFLSKEITEERLSTGNILPVKISHLTPERIVLEHIPSNTQS